MLNSFFDSQEKAYDRKFFHVKIDQLTFYGFWTISDQNDRGDIYEMSIF